MKKRAKIFKAVSLATTIILLAIGFIGAEPTSAGAATVKPALVKNTDEPGRIPYEMQVQYAFGICIYGCTDAGSNNDITGFTTTAVPAGKRFVIQHVSGHIPTISAGSAVEFKSFETWKVKFGFYGPFFPLTTNTSGFSSQVFTTVEPGEGLIVNVNTASPSHNMAFCNITISGYLIDASN